jgi:hypothetical protein
MVRGDALAHPGLDRREVVRRERAREVEVVVEPVVDGRADPETRAGEEVEHRLGHHVRRGVAHGVELAVRPGVEQFLRRPAIRGERDQLLRLDSPTLPCSLRVRHVDLQRIDDASRPDRTRGVPPAVPPAFAPRPGGSRSHAALTGGPGPVHRPLAGGAVPGGGPPRLTASGRGSLGLPTGGRVPLDAFSIWWAVEDLNLWPHACQACALTN